MRDGMTGNCHGSSKIAGIAGIGKSPKIALPSADT
jgi:hypothetical protein